MDADKIVSLTLTVTEKCNLKCSYCYEKNKTQHTMDINVAKKIIDKEFDNPYKEVINIDFFGGEPFLNFTLIKQLVEYIKNKKTDKKYTLFATTNGTLIHGEIKKWLIENRNIFSCGLSLDGTKAMQDLNRSNSFDLIDIKFFQKYYLEQGVKMTISEYSLPFLAEGVIFLHKLGFDVKCNLAFGIDWSNQTNREILELELKKLINFYLENDNIKPCTMLNNDIKLVGKRRWSEKTIKKWCGAGTHMHTYDVYGNKYPCQFFMPLSSSDKLDIPKDEEFLQDIPIELFDKKCRECVIRDVCPTCYGSNFVSTGNMYKKDDNLCELTKIIFKARSMFRALQWKQKKISLSEEDEVALLNAIMKIQKELLVD